MKIRNGFVSNSSSTAFIIFNKTNEEKTLLDFVKENEFLVDQYNKEYGYGEEIYTNEHLIKCAENRGDVWKPNESKHIVFGDEEGDEIGCVYDYILRNGGSSESFSWRFYESLR